MLDEEAFISLIKAGDARAFKQLVEAYSDRVYNTCLGMLQNTGDAEDLVQEVFIEVFNSAAGFRGDAKLSTWIYRISVTKSLELLRSKKRKKRFAYIKSLFGDEGAELQVDKGHFNHPGVQLENKEIAVVLFKAVEQLPETQKTAFILNKVEGLSYQEICSVMDVTLPAVESLLFRAKQNLKTLLNTYYEENEK